MLAGGHSGAVNFLDRVKSITIAYLISGVPSFQTFCFVRVLRLQDNPGFGAGRQEIGQTLQIEEAGLTRFHG